MPDWFIPEYALQLSMALPLIAMALVFLTGERLRNVRDSLTVVMGIATFATVCTLVQPVMAGARPRVAWLYILPNIPISFELEPLGLVFALVASGLWIVTSLYGFGYMRGHHEKNQTRFFMCFAVAIFAALGIAYARNLVTLFLFYEVLTFSTYPLVTHHGTAKAKTAGRIYLGVLVFTSVTLLLAAIIWTWQLTGSMDFTPGGILDGKVSGGMAAVLLGLFAFGTGKAGLMPFHRWLPNAMVAPTPVSALLHAVAVVKAGVFTVLKVVIYIFGVDFLADTGASDWLMWAATFTLVAASIIALTKDNLKARLAYSTVSQLAYIVLAGALANELAAIGGGMHIAMHAMGKITLFFVAGAIYVAAHKTDISDMDGIGRQMPWTMAAFFIGSLSIIGLPPTGGSWSKWFMGLGAADGGNSFFIAIYMLSSLLSIAYLMPVVARGFFFAPKPSAHGHGHDDAHGHKGGHHDPPGRIREPLLLCGPPVITAIGCLALFIFAPQLQALLATIQWGG
jgi:multicomponent Na+:H+ antiporter subunit D